MQSEKDTAMNRCRYRAPRNQLATDSARSHGIHSSSAAAAAAARPVASHGLGPFSPSQCPLVRVGDLEMVADQTSVSAHGPPHRALGGSPGLCL
jgi:hypothetical protein